jgi:Uma2 family endonuclease
MMIQRAPPRAEQLGFASAGLRMTPQEYQAHEDWDEGFRYELIHGVLIVSPPPNDEEVGSSDYLSFILNYYKRFHPQGAALDGTLPEREFMTGDSVRRADRAIWTGLGRNPRPKLDVPSILIEFLSPGRQAFRRDYEEKRDEYLSLGVKEYWVIDRFSREMTVFTGEPGQIREQLVSEQQVYQTPLLPGFEFPLAQVLKIADEWKEDS